MIKGNYPDMMISDGFTKLANRFGRHCLPYTLHPTPYTLHPTPYTLHPTPYTLLPTPYSLLPTPYSLENAIDLTANWYN
ncbi:MAG: hypothetical protein F6J99_42910, partial [Moorea sp. SIO4G3]|nr:hypothetical protein [Moorena sp. SIO4G3]